MGVRTPRLSPRSGAGPADRAAAAFREAYGRPPDGVWSAPGRVNLIGEHTDYNDGFVTPFALPRGVAAAAERRDDGTLEAWSLQRPDERARTPPAELAPGAVEGWSGYVAGVLWALRSAGHAVGGASVVVDADLPVGAGLSSSAALECATAAALDELYGLGVPRPELARLAQRAENDFVGMPCGIMDQSAALLCRAGSVLFLDTRDLSVEQVPFDVAAAGLTLLVVDTNAPHRHVGGEYAARRRDCERAAESLGVAALRDIGEDELAAALGRLGDPTLRRRTRHVVAENARALEVVRRLRDGDVTGIGSLLTASHASLRDDYEVSWPQADVAVEWALSAGALGARMTGGGFGGCVIALVPEADVETVRGAIERAYAEHGWDPPDFLPATPAAGAHRVT
ncbi:MAG: galactokinase [Streptosporangiales bacterium]|nr:galactokinase [Streptosporangiales bacterium]